MISPTVGSVVWFRKDRNEAESGFAAHSNQPCAAIVAYVWNDRMVNLSVFDHNGSQHSRTSVHLRQPEDPIPSGSYCEWMPYQKGQAAKTEHLEGHVGDTPTSAG